MGRQSGWRQAWREWRGFVIFFGLMLVFRSAVADYMYVPSGSMNPTLLDGDRIMVDKRAFGWRLPLTLVRLTAGEDPRRGDIVVFESPKNGVTLVKRVIGLPGDTVAMVDDRLTINGQAVDYSAAPDGVGAQMIAEFRNAPHELSQEHLPGREHDIMVLPQRPAMRDFGPVTVPADSYWVMGDNRDDSADSRFIGAVPRRYFVGRATGVMFSLNADDHWLPRSGRWFTSLQ